MKFRKDKLDELLTDVDESLPLSVESLEGVAGGKIGIAAGLMLSTAIASFKADGVTLDEAIAAIPDLYVMLMEDEKYKKYLEQSNVEEITEYVKTHW